MSNRSVTATTTESRALDLLGSGVGPEQTAAALGVSPSFISQLLSREDFADEVAKKRYENLLKHNNRDSEYDKLEDRLIEKMKNVIDFMHKPMELARILQVINNAKRRGSSAPEQLTQQHTVVQLNIPIQIVQQFQKNATNTVVRAGEQDLVTVQSGRMATLLSEHQKSLPAPGAKHVLPVVERAENAPTSR